MVAESRTAPGPAPWSGVVGGPWEGGFVPAWWLPGPQLQTVGARLTRSHGGVRLERERVVTPDGDFLDLDWARTAADPRAGRPLAIVLHGLEGSARSGYALETYRQLDRRGVAAVGLNFRSCSGELNRAPRLYHSGDTGDLRHVVRLLARRFPRRSLAAVGFSLGGNVLLKSLGEEGQGGGGLVAAAAVSVPYDLAAGAAHTEHGLVRVYVWWLLRSLKRKLRARAAAFRDLVNLRAALAARTFREFDDAGTAPLHGFADADDYYRRSSSAPYLGSIRVPTLLVHAADDPFLPAAAVPRDAVAGNSMLDARFTERGGHVGFVDGAPWRPRFWAECSVAEHVARAVGRAS
jgi:predicted alpha/beta-fold hydrolase